MSVIVKLSHKSAEIKALAFDLDGTLLAPGGVLTGRTLQAVRGCAQKGLELIIATGRATAACERYRLSMEATGPMVYFNGAIIADMPSGIILNSTLLSKEIVNSCLELSEQEGIYFQMYIPGTGGRKDQPLLTEAENVQRDMYYRHTGLLAEICDLRETLKDPQVSGCIKCMFLAEPELLDKLRPVVEKRFGTDVYAVRSTDTFLEILNPGVSKGLGLGLALKQRGIKAAQTIVFGDEENDLPMFAGAGLSVAPANAKDKVRAAADLVTVSNAEDGVALFLEEYILQQKF